MFSNIWSTFAKGVTPAPESWPLGGDTIGTKMQVCFGPSDKESGGNIDFVSTNLLPFVGRFMHVWRDSSEVYKTAHKWMRFRVHRNRYFLLIPYQMAGANLHFNANSVPAERPALVLVAFANLLCFPFN